jgi:phage tail sheath protein FI
MPVPPEYPGVYVEEIPGPHAIEGVDTSITAFVGAAARGLANSPVTIKSFRDFENLFGGLYANSQLGYVIRDFFANGGTTALIVRIVPTDATPASIPLDGFPADTLLAASEGAWGNSLHAVVDANVDPDVATSLGLTEADLFNLTIYDDQIKLTEIFSNLTIKDTPRRVDRVLAAESTLVRIAPDAALTSIPVANPAPAAGVSPWLDPNANTTATPASGSDGSPLAESDFVDAGYQESQRGLYALLKADLFNIMCIPPYTASEDVDASVIAQAAALCEERHAFLLIDPPTSWTNVDAAVNGLQSLGTNSPNAAVYFSRIIEPDLLQNNSLVAIAPCGAIAGVIARTDSQRGVWKSPAGVAAQLEGISSLQVAITDADNSRLNSIGVNCLRKMPAVGNAVWGARTLQGADSLGSEWKYIAIRRLTIFIEESLYKGLQWVVFEPNGEPLWAQIRLAVGSFMNDLFRRGALQGVSEQQAWYVKCDGTTTTQNDIDQGLVNTLVGFAPLRPAEFIIVQIQQAAAPPCP